jgi:uncharacterized membrane protein
MIIINPLWLIIGLSIFVWIVAIIAILLYHHGKMSLYS